MKISNRNQLVLLTSLRNLLEKCGSHQALVEQIHGRSITLGLLRHQHLACKLLTSYSKLNKPLVGQKQFDEMSTPDIVSWTSLRNCYLTLNSPHKALSLFSLFVISTSFKPDAHSIVAALRLSRNLVIYMWVKQCMPWRINICLDLKPL